MRSPFVIFSEWYKTAQTTRAIEDASAMALATASPGGIPSVRMVLLKAADERGFVFYTNLLSPKARDLQANPRAALCFHWAPLQRQVRIDGTVEPVSSAEADAYHHTRPRGSQLGAWASQQSAPMESFFDLEKNAGAAALRFGLGSVPRPPHWSGFRLTPVRMEFWTQQSFRLHERIAFSVTPGGWQEQRLYP